MYDITRDASATVVPSGPLRRRGSARFRRHWLAGVAATGRRSTWWCAPVEVSDHRAVEGRGRGRTARGTRGASGPTRSTLNRLPGTRSARCELPWSEGRDGQGRITRVRVDKRGGGENVDLNAQGGQPSDEEWIPTSTVASGSRTSSTTRCS